MIEPFSNSIADWIKMNITYERCPYSTGYYVNSQGEIIPAPCKNWDCPYCVKWRRKQLLDRVHTGFDIIKSMYPAIVIYFLTLTLSPEAVNEDIMKYWARFRAGLSKIGIKGYCYFWVKEFTKNGIRHLHIAHTAEINNDNITKIWYRVTGNTSYITYNMPAIDLKNVAGYMMPYITKDLGSSLYRPLERRYGFSQYKIDGSINPFKLNKWKPDGQEDPIKFEFAPSYNYIEFRKRIPEFVKEWNERRLFKL